MISQYRILEKKGKPVILEGIESKSIALVPQNQV